MADPDAIRRTFVELADTAVDRFDLLQFLHRLALRAVELLDVADAGVVLNGPSGELQAVTSAGRGDDVVELLDLECTGADGPGREAQQTGRAVREHDLTANGSRWPSFGAAARRLGYQSVYVVPMRLRADAVGALALFAVAPHGLSADGEALGQAMADVATIGIVQERAVRYHRQLSDQLSEALRTRVVLEQAKGVLAEQGGVEVDHGFESMRRYARDRNLKLASVARSVVDRKLSFDDLARRSG